MECVTSWRLSALEITVLFQVADSRTHFSVLPLICASNLTSRGCFLRSMFMVWEFTQLSKATFPSGWKTPCICVQIQSGVAGCISSPLDNSGAVVLQNQANSLFRAIRNFTYFFVLQRLEAFPFLPASKFTSTPHPNFS